MSVGNGIRQLPSRTREPRFKGMNTKSRLEQREAALKKQREAFVAALPSPPSKKEGER